MIKVQSFLDRDLSALSKSIENFIKLYKINRKQIISINFTANQYSKFALLTYEEE